MYLNVSLATIFTTLDLRERNLHKGGSSCSSASSSPLLLLLLLLGSRRPSNAFREFNDLAGATLWQPFGQNMIFSFSLPEFGRWEPRGGSRPTIRPPDRRFLVSRRRINCCSTASLGANCESLNYLRPKRGLSGSQTEFS